MAYPGTPVYLVGGAASYKRYVFVTGLQEQTFVFPQPLQMLHIVTDRIALVRFNDPGGDRLRLDPGDSLDLTDLTVASMSYVAPDWRAQWGQVKIFGVYL